MDLLEIRKTADGSLTVYNSEFDEHYHSVNGAFEESMHIFIKTGFLFCEKSDINIFEVGFGTGLNAILTFLEAAKNSKKVNYYAIEKYPLTLDFAKNINYSDFFNAEIQKIFEKIHKVEWERGISISDNFTIYKICADLIYFTPFFNIDLIYFDAFSFEKQPNLWSLDIFKKLFDYTNDNGVLTTYASKGIIKQNLRNAGFYVKRLAGPKGKRHIVRAIKSNS